MLFKSVRALSFEINMTRDTVGEFEQLVLLAVLRLGSSAYGVPIVDEIVTKTGREVLRPAVYVTLRRLEEKGLLESSLGEPTPERGGRAKKYFVLTPEGLSRLREARRALVNMWEGFTGVLDERSESAHG